MWKCILITAKAMGVVFSLFDVTSAWEVPLGIQQYVQCILQGLSSSVLLCVPLIFADSGFFLALEMEIVYILHSSCIWLQRYFWNSSWFVLLCNGVNIRFSDDHWLNWGMQHHSFFWCRMYKFTNNTYFWRHQAVTQSILGTTAIVHNECILYAININIHSKL